MPELNLNQISDKLNSEFVGDTRKLIFWYDENADFIEDIDSICLENAKIYHLEKDNQFMTKYLLEREDKTTNYLIYAPFKKPELINNHLADTIRYSKEFFADRASLITLDLGIGEKYKEIVQKYISFFGNKDRIQKFYDLEIENYNESVIETAIMSVICKTKTSSFEDVVRIIITDEEMEDSQFLKEFEKYGLLESFWKMCEETFGYSDKSPSVIKLIYTIFITYMSKMVTEELPKSLDIYKSYKSGSIIAFLDGIMNSLVYSEHFERLSKIVYKDLKISDVLTAVQASSLARLEIFADVDKKIISWIIERLLDEDLAAKLDGRNIVEVCDFRNKMHFKEVTAIHYHILKNAYYIIESARFTPKQNSEEILKDYVSKDYKIDQRYRFFYYYFDKLENNQIYENLVQLVENIYTNRFLNPLCVAWSESLKQNNGKINLPKQSDFYNNFVKPLKERVVVIISDAMRYEVGQSLLKRLLADEKCDAKMHEVSSVLPSYTRFGMSALLPHNSLEMTDDNEILVDSKMCYDLKSREQILKEYNPNSVAVKFDEIKTTKIAREITTGQQVVYIYHDQIDARGDKLPTENEAFNACEEAVIEIHVMIKRLTSASNTKFFITADHGFIYKREKLSSSDKIKGAKNSFMGKRYIVSDSKLDEDGVFNIPMETILKNDPRNIALPIGSDIFSVAGGGQNFVHGGSSLQEMIVPVIEVKTNKNFTETQNVSISIVSILNKVTNLNLNIDFIQNEPVTDIYKETTYRIYFISDYNEKISNEIIHSADKKEKDSSKRMFRLRFTFKNKKYDASRKHFLVVTDEKTGLEVIRHEVKMDLAFVDDFGF